MTNGRGAASPKIPNKLTSVLSLCVIYWRVYGVREMTQFQRSFTVTKLFVPRRCIVLKDLSLLGTISRNFYDKIKHILINDEGTMRIKELIGSTADS